MRVHICRNVYACGEFLFPGGAMHSVERLSRDLFAAEESGQVSEGFLRSILTSDFTITRFKGNLQNKEQYLQQTFGSPPAGRRVDAIRSAPTGTVQSFSVS